MRVATDVGGTFTDLVYFKVNEDKGGVSIVGVEKSDTTPPNFEQGVLNVIRKAGLDPKEFDFFAHGCTVVINALLSRNGAKTALITTRGFRDVLEIARGNRPDLFNFRFKKPEPFVPRYLRYEVSERLDPYGDVITPLALDELPAIIENMKANDVESVAICLLHSYVNPSHEKAIVEELHRLWPEVSVIASVDVNREWREYERTSTVALSAYVYPVAKRYLQLLEDKLVETGLRAAPYIMQSSGGIATTQAARQNPITMIESGPASGVLGAIALGHAIGEPNILALDIGGTTAKCALIENHTAKVTTEYKIEHTATNPGYPIHTPVFEIVEIGNGGGSIAWIDEGGKLHVGPVSAGAYPGPVAYGQGGTEPTTTDAQLVSGRIGQDFFRGGEIHPDMNAVNGAFQRLASQLGGEPIDVARGIIRLANANMENALKLVSVNKGHDPRDFTLMAFGGGGAMHAVELAEQMGMKKVIIPNNSSVFSAWGMLMTDLRRDLLQTKALPMTELALPEINALFDEMIAQLRTEYEAEGFAADKVRVELFTDLRYEGQEHAVKLPLGVERITAADLPRIIDDFHAAHEREYTLSHKDSEVQIVNFHAVGWVPVNRPDIARVAKTGRTLAQVKRGARDVDFQDTGFVSSAVYDLDQFEPDMSVVGPAIIENKTTTIVVLPGKTAAMDDFGNIIVTL